MQKGLVIGLDYGSDSVRAVLIDSANGAELAADVHYYQRWARGEYCEPANNQFRQHPQDYIDGLETSIHNLFTGPDDPRRAAVKGIAVDTTGSTPVAVDQSGTPLAMLADFAENPNAMFVLWKDHTAIVEAEQINAHAAKYTPNYLQYVGGIYSSEWFWAKLLHVIREDEAVRKAAYSWVEHCDWIPFLLTGGTDVREMKRSRCAAGHKALWYPDWGLPPNDFWTALDPLLDGVVERLFTETDTSDVAAGSLSSGFAERLGLSTEVVVAVGAFDAHMGAVGGEIQAYSLSRIMGTSTCDILIAPEADLNGQCVQGICGQVEGSVVPGFVGLEAGQSAFGDVYAWFRNLLSWSFDLIPENTPQRSQLIEQMTDALIPTLSKVAADLPLEGNHELALDWFNGRRTPDANQRLKGALFSLNLGSDAPRVFRALVEATCFGARAIVERFQAEGVPIKELIGLGGVAKKSPFVMQTLADVLQRPIKVARSEQTCALGAAMFAATAAGIYPDVSSAQAQMGQGFEQTYLPNPENATHYDQLYQRYQEAGAFVETVSR